MTILKTKFITGENPQPDVNGSEVVSVQAELIGLNNLADNDMLAMCYLPEDCVPVDYVIASDDLDANGAPELVVDFGIFNAAQDAISTDAADGGDEWLDGSTALQAAVVIRPTAVTLWRVLPSKSRRTVGFKVMTDPATDPGAGAKLSLIFSYRAAYQGR